MKKQVFVLIGDLLHPEKRMKDLIGKYFNNEKYQVCVLRNLDEICMISGAPDLIVNFKDARDNWRQDTPNHYDEYFMTQIGHYVNVEGCGYIAVHAGCQNVPKEHPIRVNVLQGGADIPDGGNQFDLNLLYRKTEGASPFGTFTDVTFVPVVDHPVVKGIEPFTIRDEQMEITIDPGSDAVVLGFAESEIGGKTIGAWAREAGKGKAVGIAIGHLKTGLTDPGMMKLIQNAITWCTR